MIKQRLIIISLFALSLLACSSDEDITTNNPTGDVITEEPPQETISFLALGDSYTIGQGVEESERWPNQLTVELESIGFTVEKTEIIAQTGWRTSNLIDAVEANDPKDFNLVSLLIGVNNQFNGQDFEIFVDEFDILIQKATQIAGQSNRVFVVSIPDYGVTPFGNSWGNSQQIASEIDMYNNHISQKCSELGIPFINITDISRSLGASEGALASDDLHPSGFQYGLWVDEILPIVLEMLSD